MSLQVVFSGLGFSFQGFCKNLYKGFYMVSLRVTMRVTIRVSMRTSIRVCLVLVGASVKVGVLRQNVWANGRTANGLRAGSSLFESLCIKGFGPSRVSGSGV